LKKEILKQVLDALLYTVALLQGMQVKFRKKEMRILLALQLRHCVGLEGLSHVQQLASLENVTLVN